MSNLLAMFPGQGSQSIGMGKDLLDLFPYTRQVFEEAEDATHLEIRKLCLEGPAHQLTLTSNQQPCILSVSVAIWKVLQEEAGIECQLVAGHSLGEYSALVASGRLDLTDAAYLVHKRGLAMQEAVEPGDGAMAAVLGMEADTLMAFCRANITAGQVCEVVNFNSPAQQIISGDAQAVNHICEALTAAKTKCKMLPVSAPFHSSLMAPARQQMTPLLNKTKFQSSTIPIIANLSGELVNTYEPQLLIDQISQPVLWTKTMDSAYQEGSRRFLEVGPGKVLFGLARRCLPRDVKISHCADLPAAIQWLASK